MLGRFHNYTILKKYACPGSLKSRRIFDRKNSWKTGDINSIFDFSSINHMYYMKYPSNHQHNQKITFPHIPLNRLNPDFIYISFISGVLLLLLSCRLFEALHSLFKPLCDKFMDHVLSNQITLYDSYSSVLRPFKCLWINFIRGISPLYVVSETQQELARKRERAFRLRNKEKIKEYQYTYYRKHKEQRKVDFHKNYEKRKLNHQKTFTLITELNSTSSTKRKIQNECSNRKEKMSRSRANDNINKSNGDADESNHDPFKNDDAEHLQKLFSRIDKKFCHATTVEVEDEEDHQPNHDIQQANICVVCDRLIIGLEDVKKISKENLILNENCLSVAQYEEHFSLSLKTELIKQYEVNDSDLKGLLLSPRAKSVSEGKHYHCCTSCFTSLTKSRTEDNSTNPPKFSIANGFAIGHIPHILRFKTKSGILKTKKISIEDDFDDIFSAAISPVRPFGYVHAYMGGSQKSITGHFSFFSIDQSHVGGVLNKYRNIKNAAKNIFIVLCGRMTPDQKKIVQRKVSSILFAL